MRKVFIVLIAVIILTATTLLLLNDKETNESVSILTIANDYQRVITDNEELSITVFVSKQDSFLTDKTYIDSAYLKSIDETIQIEISEIRDLSHKQIYQDIEYNAYSIDLNFSRIQVMNYQMNLEDCLLEISYLNSRTISLEIGNLYLLFQDIQEDSLLMVDRMYAIYNESDFEYISGIFIAIDNFSNLDISITDIYCNNQNIQFDLSETIIVEEAVSYNLGINEALNKTYSSVGIVHQNESIQLEHYTNLLIPLKYRNRLLKTNRFPMMIDYEFNGKTYTHIIDDFIFNSNYIDLEGTYGLLREYIYYY